MTSTQDVVLGAAVHKKQRKTEKRHRPKRTSKPGKKRLYILLDDTKKAFDGWEDLPEPWTLEWCHIGKGFPHDRYKIQRRADKANLHHCEWPIFKERCIEMCQHIYEKPFLERNECPFSILRMVHAEVVLGKRVDWMTIKIQTNSNMKAPLSPFFGKRRKFPNGGLTKKMPPKNSTPNNMVVHSPESSDDEKNGCTPAVRHAILDNIKGQMVHNTLIEMVANEPIEEPLPHQAIEELLLHQAIEGGIMDMERKGRLVDPPWMRVFPTWRSLGIPLIRLRNWNKNWQLQKPS
jgi:hypothetical protein